MAQNDFTIANQTFPNTRSDINSALQALAGLSSGTSAPSTTYAYQLWADTTNTLLKIRNGANSAWVTIGTLDAANLALLPLAGGSLAGAVNWIKGSNVASSATTDIGAATGNVVDVTGTTTITSLGSTGQAGAVRVVRFTGVLLLTYHSANLILPGAASITTAANDVAVFVSLGGGSWYCAAYQRASGQAVISNQVTPNQQTFTSSGTWTKPSTGTYARVQVWGAGGGGGSSNTFSGGGGGGSYKEAVFLLSSLGSTESVTIGAGGSGSTGGTGGGGGSTSFGSHLTGYGGGGGGVGGTNGGCGGGLLANAYSSNPSSAPSGNDICPDPGGNVSFEGMGGGHRGTSVAVGGYYTGGGGVNGSGYGGNSVWGGGGGCGGAGTPGSSKFGGAGGAGVGGHGSVPGGGGGSDGNSGGGNGASGKCVVMTW